MACLLDGETVVAAIMALVQERVQRGSRLIKDKVHQGITLLHSNWRRLRARPNTGRATGKHQL